ncbi:TPA: hypothetical protein ACH3X1_015285 [Trebouxia sp. C0004]
MQTGSQRGCVSATTLISFKNTYDGRSTKPNSLVAQFGTNLKWIEKAGRFADLGTCVKHYEKEVLLDADANMTAANLKTKMDPSGLDAQQDHARKPMTPSHGKMQSPLLSAALQIRLTAALCYCNYTYGEPEVDPEFTPPRQMFKGANTGSPRAVAGQVGLGKTF